MQCGFIEGHIYIVGRPGEINARIVLTKYFIGHGVAKHITIFDLPINGTWNCNIQYLSECNAHIERSGAAVQTDIKSATAEFNIGNEEIVNSDEEFDDL